MDFALVLFCAFAAILLAASLAVISVRNPVHAALFLVLAFFTAAGLWILLEAEFLALTLVLVYVGAVMVLFLFVVMMLDVNLDRLRQGFWSNLPLAGLVGVLMAAEMVALLWRGAATPGSAPGLPPAGYSNTKALGRVLYTDYVFPFELAAVVLLVAIVAAIAITLRHKKATKFQDARVQLAVRASDRLRMVDMPSDAAPPTVGRQGGAQ